VHQQEVTAVRKPVLLVALLGAAAALAKRTQAQRSEREVWHAATAAPPPAPDLR
jgi:hypothetical protein